MLRGSDLSGQPVIQVSCRIAVKNGFNISWTNSNATELVESISRRVSGNLQSVIYMRSFYSENEHSVAEAVETVLPGDGFLVSPIDDISTGKGGNQHQQR